MSEPTEADVRATLTLIEQRRKEFQLAFGSPAGAEVLVDLAKFCRAAETCAVPGDRDRTMILEGRREVWLRIQQHLNLTPAQLFTLYSGRPLVMTGDEQ